MAINPTPRRRIRAAEPPPVQPRARARPAQPEHGIYENYDGPAPLAPQRDEVSGQMVIPQRPLHERVDLMAELDPEAAEDMMLATLQQFLLAKTPPDTICQRMQISARSLRTLRDKLVKKQREQVKARDPYDFISPMLAEFEEAKATAWREIALAKPAEWSRRMRALDVIARANADIARLLQVGGAFDNQPLRAPLASDDEDAGGANVLRELATRFLTGGYQPPETITGGLRPGDRIVEGN